MEKRKKFAVVTAAGLGDGLIFHIASHFLVQNGQEVTTFNDHLPELGAWLSGYSLEKQPPIEEIERRFAFFDAVILQHDNTEKARKMKSLSLPVFAFYGTYQFSKHGPLSSLDFVGSPDQTMVQNLLRALRQWFAKWSQEATKENGLKPPKGLIHQKYDRRIAIHSMSPVREKNWPWEKFECVAKALQKKGYTPEFLCSREGQFRCPTLETLASYLYESKGFIGVDSGPGHLASCLNIPTTIIAQEEKHMRLWKGSWLAPHLVLPPSWTSHFRWTKKRWGAFISPKQVVEVAQRVFTK